MKQSLFHVAAPETVPGIRARAGLPLCLGVMSLGTVLVLAGLYASDWSR
jgi:hypothetical protein